MMNGTMIENMVVGGPAYNSKQLEHGDVILEVDGQEAKNENIFEVLIGCDVPGSAVNIKLAKGGPQVVFTFSHLLLQDSPLIAISFPSAGSGTKREIEKDGHQRDPRPTQDVRAVQHAEGTLQVSLATVH